MQYLRRIEAIFVLASAITSFGCQNTDLNAGAALNNDTATVVPEDPCPKPADIPIVINEVMLENEGSVIGPGGAFLPWIEIHNPEAVPFDLGGATITDDFSDVDKWEFPCGPESIIGSGEYRVLFFGGPSGDPGDLVIDFFPAASGPITLSLNGENTLEIAAFDAEELFSDETVGRSPDVTGDFTVLLEPTPGAPNAPPLEAPPALFVRGDADEDGDVDADDLATWTELVLLGLGRIPPCEDRLDVNDDGVIDIADGNFLALALEPGGPAIPPPFPEIGPDLTDDALPCESEVSP